MSPGGWQANKPADEPAVRPWDEGEASKQASGRASHQLWGEANQASKQTSQPSAHEVGSKGADELVISPGGARCKRASKESSKQAEEPAIIPLAWSTKQGSRQMDELGGRQDQSSGAVEPCSSPFSAAQSEHSCTYRRAP